MSHFFAYLSRMKHIERWGLMRSFRKENIQEHSLSVSLLAHALALTKREVFREQIDADKCALLALYHDVNEVLTGDLPTPVKYFNEEIRTSYKSLEGYASEKLLSMLPGELKNAYSPLLTPEPCKELTLVKLADKLDAYLKCVEEKSSGNREFLKAEESILEDLRSANDNAVNYFFKIFAESYSLTLDELK